MTVNEIILLIKDIASNLSPVQSVYDGDVYENWNSAETKYGSVNIGLQTITNDGSQTAYTMVLYYGDRLLQDKKNSNSIISDGVRVLQSIINTLNTVDDVNIGEVTIFTPFEQKFVDYLAGVYVTVDIVCESDLGLCNMDNYEYISDNEQLIEQLIEKINEYREQDSELAELLKTILHKIDGTEL